MNGIPGINQSSAIAGFLLVGFIVYITLRKQLADYIGLITGPSQPGSDVAVKTPAGETAPTQQAGTCVKYNADGTCGQYATYSQDGSINAGPIGSIGPAPTGGTTICSPGLKALGMC